MKLVLAVLALAALTAQAEVLQLSYKPPAPAQRHLPFAGNGTCGPATHDKGTRTTTVTCLGPPHILSPGQTIDTMMLLESPFPLGKLVRVINNTAQLVDDQLRPVPLSDVYLHHFGGQFISGSGAEVRGSFQRKPLPAPYAVVFNGTEAAKFPARMTNIQLINTVGIPEEDAKACLECWCDHNPFHKHHAVGTGGVGGADHDRGDPTHNATHPASLAGSYLCCHQCPTNQPLSGPRHYHLQYTMTFQEIQEGELVKPVQTSFYDVTGGRVEYQLTEGRGAGAEHVATWDAVVAPDCPQATELELVRCIGHQHFGGKCLSFEDPETNATICQTCPTFGRRKGVPGDEEGYVVAVTDDDLALTGRTYRLKPGQRIRVKSVYDASVPRFGIMGIMFPQIAGWPAECNPTPGYGDEYVYTSDSDPASLLSVPLYGSMFGVPMAAGAMTQQPSVVS